MGIYFLLLIIGIVVLCMIYGLYAGVIQKRNKTEEALSGIDVHLKKRYDLIPNILFIANKFMEHERSLIEDITKLRTEAVGLASRTDANTVGRKIDIDNSIADKMHQLLVSVENYPQLKSDNTMIQAMQTYAEVEEHIAAARRFYNSAARELKNAIEIFPSSLFAAMLGISAYPFFEATDAERKPINAADYFKK